MQVNISPARTPTFHRPEWNRYNGPAATRENRPAGTPPAPLSHALRDTAQPAAP